MSEEQEATQTDQEREVEGDLPTEVVLGPPPRRVPLGLRLLCLFEGAAGCAWAILFFGLIALGGLIEVTSTSAGAMRVLWVAGIVISSLIVLLGALGVVELYREGVRACRFLACGELAAARALRWESPAQRTYLVTVAFTDGAGTARETAIRTHKWVLCEATRAIPLLYDPADTTLAIAVEDLPHEPAFDGTGGFRRPPYWDVAGGLGFPLLTLLVPGSWFIRMLVRLLTSVLH